MIFVNNRVLIDSNVLLDILLEDKNWYQWSSSKLSALAETSSLVINPIIYSEVSIGFSKIEDLEAALPHQYFQRENIPWEAAFLAGKCFLDYKKRGGNKKTPLPDFFIGAHALTGGMTLVSRDKARYKTYFPKLSLISP